MPGPKEMTRTLLDAYAREPGRSAAVVVDVAGAGYAAGVNDHVQHPAASLLKLPLAVAAAQLTGSVEVSRLRTGERGVLNVLQGRLDAREVLGLSLVTSDNDCARWLLDQVGLAAVAAVVADAGCTATRIEARDGLLTGVTTAADALCLLRSALAVPVVAQAMSNSVLASRIPLGATDLDVTVAHKTGTLSGVAHDVARLECDRGEVLLAFLSDSQHDTLVTGYAMGLCTRGILTAWGLGVRHSGGFA